MVAQYAREALKKENKLLDEMTQRASAFAKNAVGVEADIFNDWVRYLRSYHEINDELISKDDPALDQELKAEIKLLEGMSKAIPSGDKTEVWRTNYKRDLDILKKLL